jgi:hypothetical protein
MSLLSAVSPFPFSHSQDPKPTLICTHDRAQGRYDVFQLGEVAVPRALFAEILRRNRPAQAKAAAALGMKYKEQRSTATQRARCVHDYEGRHKPGPNAGRKPERPVLRDFEADSSPRNLAAPERRMVGLQEPASGESRSRLRSGTCGHGCDRELINGIE